MLAVNAVGTCNIVLIQMPVINFSFGYDVSKILKQMLSICVGYFSIMPRAFLIWIISDPLFL